MCFNKSRRSLLFVNRPISLNNLFKVLVWGRIGGGMTTFRKWTRSVKIKKGRPEWKLCRSHFNDNSVLRRFLKNFLQEYVRNIRITTQKYSSNTFIKIDMNIELTGNKSSVYVQPVTVISNWQLSSFNFLWFFAVHWKHAFNTKQISGDDRHIMILKVACRQSSALEDLVLLLVKKFDGASS